MNTIKLVMEKLKQDPPTTIVPHVLYQSALVSICGSSISVLLFLPIGARRGIAVAKCLLPCLA